MNACAGPDERDQYSLPAQPVDFVRALRGPLKGVRVAWAADLGFVKALHPEVKSACARAARRFREFGCRVDEVEPGWPSPKPFWEDIFCGGIATRLGPYMADRRADIDPGLAPIIDGVMRWTPTRYVQAWFDRLA
jgi:aspartyl-tRNA(Asn)/glutamyl-tRNA(Gln) amidotransferase subunit A